MNRTAYSQQAKRIQNRMELLFIPSVYRILRKQLSSFTSEVRRSGLQYARSRLGVNLMDAQVAEVIQNLYLKAGRFAARATRENIMRETAKSAGAAKGLQTCRQPSLQLKRGFGFNERMTQDILEYFRLHLLEKAVLPISATTRVRIETVLNRGVTEGWGVDRILQELEGPDFRNMTRRRARTIVRTETVRAMNYGMLAAAHDSEYEQEKIWMAVHDNRTRTSHRHGTGVDGERRDLLKPFSNGLMFPGDPEGPAEETIMCRCTMAIRSKRDAQGRLIPKRRGIVVSLASTITSIYRRIAAVLSSF